MRKVILFAAWCALVAGCGQNTSMKMGYSTADTATVITINAHQAYFHLTGIYNPAKKYNVWITMPGSGESVGPVSVLKGGGPFQSIVDSTVMDTSLIIIGPQPNLSYVDNSEMQGYITAARSMFNVNKIAVSGYSLGCQDWSNFLWTSEGNFKQVSAWFMSSADPTSATVIEGSQTTTISQHPAWFATDSVYYDGICGTADGFFGPQNALYDSVLSYKPHYTPSFTVLNGVGHTSASWGPYFSPYYKDPATGLSKYTTFMKLFPVSGSVVTPPAPIPAPTTKTIKSIVVTYNDGSTQSIP